MKVPVHRPQWYASVVLSVALAAGCATVTPQYTVRPAPVIEDTPVSREIEQTISNYQAQELEKSGVRRVGPGETIQGFALQRIVDRVSRVTERPAHDWRVLLMTQEDPDAAALADGRIYLSTGMLKYLASRGSREDELAFVLGHELAHTVAQHLVKRYRQLQKQQLAMALIGLGASAVTRQGSAQAQQLGGAINSVAGLVNQAIAMGYSQEQELEADQLGMRYLIRAGYDPKPALAMVEDFKRFDRPGVDFLRTHPYTERRLEDLRRYLAESGYLSGSGTAQTSSPGSTPALSAWTAAGSGRAITLPAAGPAAPKPSDFKREQRQRLLDAQKLYPPGSQSWKNIQQQLDALK
jgi:predicted Zn-dependent protease